MCVCMYVCKGPRKLIGTLFQKEMKVRDSIRYIKVTWNDNHEKLYLITEAK